MPVNGIEAIVIDSLAQTGRFRLVERTELGNVLGEQDLAASGRIAQPSGAKIGKILGAEFLVQVVVTDYETNTSGKDGAVGGLLRKKVPLFGGVKAGSSSGRIGLVRGRKSVPVVWLSSCCSRRSDNGFDPVPAARKGLQVKKIPSPTAFRIQLCVWPLH